MKARIYYSSFSTSFNNSSRCHEKFKDPFFSLFHMRVVSFFPPRAQKKLWMISFHISSFFAYLTHLLKFPSLSIWSGITLFREYTWSCLYTWLVVVHFFSRRESNHQGISSVRFLHFHSMLFLHIIKFFLPCCCLLAGCWGTSVGLVRSWCDTLELCPFWFPRFFWLTCDETLLFSSRFCQWCSKFWLPIELYYGSSNAYPIFDSGINVFAWEEVL